MEQIKILFTNMNWLTCVVLLFFVLAMINGLRRGFVKTAVSMVSIIIIMILVGILNPYISSFLQERTPIYTVIEQKCQEVINSNISEEIAANLTNQVEFIEQLPIPQIIKDELKENNNGEVYTLFGVEQFQGYVGKYLAIVMINGIAYLLSFFIALIIVKSIAYALDIMAHLPVLKGINRIGGMVLGAVQGILAIWIFFLIITLLCNTQLGGIFLEQINQDTILSTLYNHNYLLNIIMKIF